MHPVIAEKLPLIEAICRRRHVARLELFGSAAREGFDAVRSDVDFAVELLPGANWGLSGDFFGLKSDLETLLGRDVDLISKRAIRNKYFRDEVNETAVVVYAA